LTQLASRILADSSEREAFLGDLEERHLAGTFRGLADISYLVASRQLKMWQTWRPWLTAFVLFFPLSALLQSALSIATMLERFPWPDNPVYDSPDVKTSILWGSMSTILWSWSAGFAMATLGKHAVWGLFAALALLSYLPMLFSPTPFMRGWGFGAWMLMVILPAWLGARAEYLSAKGKWLLAGSALLPLYFLIHDYRFNRGNLEAMDLAMALLVMWPIAVPFTSRAR
jgi:hypothetical protein